MSSYSGSGISYFRTYVYVDGSQASASARGYAKYESVGGSVVLPLQAGQQVTLYVSGTDTVDSGVHMFSGFRIFAS